MRERPGMKYHLMRLAVLLMALLIIVLQACKDDKCLKSAGDMAEEERALDDFGKVILKDNIILYVTQDSVNRLVVQAGANLIPYIVTTVESGVLTIGNDNTCNWLRSFDNEIKVYLYCRNLCNIDYKSSGDITGLNTLYPDSLELNFWNGAGTIKLDIQTRIVRVHMHTGPGDAELTGNTDAALYYIRGEGQLRCTGLITPYVYVDSFNTNDSYVYSNHQLDAYIAYIGNVYYSGHPPVINSVITERGQLIPLD